MSILLAHAVPPNVNPFSAINIRARKVKGIAALHRIQKMIGLSDNELLDCCLHAQLHECIVQACFTVSSSEPDSDG